MNRKQKLRVVAAAAAVLGIGQFANAATEVHYLDDFNRATVNGTYTYGPMIQYQTPGPGATDADVRIGVAAGATGNYLEMTNDATATANTTGVVSLHTETRFYNGGTTASPYDLTLTNSQYTGKVIDWTFNAQYTRATPSGFGAGNHGTAYILGGTDPDFYNAGDGYAAVRGPSTDDWYLVAYTGGLKTLGSTSAAGTRIVTSIDPGTNYASIHISYNPDGSKWSIEGRNDSATEFADATSSTPAFTPGSSNVVNTTYTGINLPYSGAIYKFATNSHTAKFDNLSLTVRDAEVAETPRLLTWGAPSDVSGNWNTANAWYDTGASAPASWNSASPDMAVLGAGTGTGGAVTVDLQGNRTTGFLSFEANSAEYTLTGGTITIMGADDPRTVATSIQGLLAKQSAVINANVNYQGAAPNMNVSTGATLTINGQLLGAGQIDKFGNGTLVLNAPAPNRSGATVIENGTIRVTSSSGGVSGLGSGAVTIKSGATLHLDATNAPISVTGSEAALQLFDQGTLRSTGSVTWQRNYPRFIFDPANPTAVTSSTIHADAESTLVLGRQLRNSSGTLAVGAEENFHTINVDGPGTVKLINGGSNGSIDSSLFSGSWNLTNGMLVLGQNSESGGSTGDTLNNLGFKAGDSSRGNRITISDSGILIGTENTANGGTLNAYKADIVLAGGSLASGNGKDANYGGPFTTTAATSSKILTYDPLTPANQRSVRLTHGSGGFFIQPGPTTWGGDVVVDNGTGGATGGSFVLDRDGGTVSVTPGVTLTVNAGSGLRVMNTLDALSDGTNHVNVVNNATLAYFTDPNTQVVSTFSGVVVSNSLKNVGNLDGTGDTMVDPGSGLNANRIRQNSLIMNADVTIRPQGGADGTSKIETLTRDPATKLNLTNNNLVTGNAVGSWNGSQYTGVLGDVASGRNSGSWNGVGINTSEADASVSMTTTLAVATGAQVKGLTAGQTATWAGQVVDDNDTLVMYTWNGDANLSGKVDADDYFQIDSNYGLAGTAHLSFNNGDFNYDGVINGDDYMLIDSGFSASQANPDFATGMALGGVSAVPEPASIGMLGIAAAGLLGRRRRH